MSRKTAHIFTCNPYQTNRKNNLPSKTTKLTHPSNWDTCLEYAESSSKRPRCPLAALVRQRSFLQPLPPHPSKASPLSVTACDDKREHIPG
eukprot:180743-Prorocentrum_minimum.AAC.1